MNEVLMGDESLINEVLMGDDGLPSKSVRILEDFNINVIMY